MLRIPPPFPKLSPSFMAGIADLSIVPSFDEKKAVGMVASRSDNSEKRSARSSEDHYVCPAPDGSIENKYFLEDLEYTPAEESQIIKTLDRKLFVRSSLCESRFRSDLKSVFSLGSLLRPSF